MGNITFEGVITRNYDNGTNTDIPTNIKLLKPFAFHGSESYLTSINIPNTISHLPDYAFSACAYITTISGLEHVEYIGENCFLDSGRSSQLKIDTITISAGTVIDEQAFYRAKIKNVVIGNNCVLKQNAFMSSTLETLIVGIGVENARLGFQSCAELTTVTYNADVCAESMFSGCSVLNSITFSNIRRIHTAAFNNCKALTSIDIPSTITSIANNAFNGCTNLTSITIDRPQDSIADAPWGATNATVTWTG